MTTLSTNCYKYAFESEVSYSLFDELDALLDCYVHSTHATDDSIEFCIETDSEERAREIRVMLGFSAPLELFKNKGE